MSYPSNNNRS